MKRNPWLFYIILPLLLLGVAATYTVVKISQFPNTASLAGTDLFLVASGTTNKNISWTQLQAILPAGAGSQVWTNDAAGFIWPAAYPAPDLIGRINPGPPILFTPSGAIWIGRNSVQDSNPTTQHGIVAFSCTDSNDFPKFNFDFVMADNEDYGMYSSFTGSLNVFTNGVDVGTAYSTLSLQAGGTNTDWASVEMHVTSGFTVSPFKITTNSVSIFEVGKYGTVNATAYRNSSGGLPGDVGGITYNLKVITNGTDTATLRFTNGVLMSVTAP